MSAIGVKKRERKIVSLLNPGGCKLPNLVCSDHHPRRRKRGKKRSRKKKRGEKKRKREELRMSRRL